jgi:hypothetical protein
MENDEQRGRASGVASTGRQIPVDVYVVWGVVGENVCFVFLGRGRVANPFGVFNSAPFDFRGVSFGDAGGFINGGMLIC